MFNNAGIVIEGDARDLTVDHWRRVLDVDLYGVLYGMLVAYPIMARQGFGHIVNTASAAAFFPDPGNAPDCTAKHALIGLSLSLRLEGTDLGVRVSAACPGHVRTNIFENAYSSRRSKLTTPSASTSRSQMPAQARYGQGGADSARNGSPVATGIPASCWVTKVGGSR